MKGDSDGPTKSAWKPKTDGGGAVCALAANSFGDHGYLRLNVAPRSVFFQKPLAIEFLRPGWPAVDPCRPQQQLHPLQALGAYSRPPPASRLPQTAHGKLANSARFEGSERRILYTGRARWACLALSQRR